MIDAFAVLVILCAAEVALWAILVVRESRRIARLEDATALEMDPSDQ